MIEVRGSTTVKIDWKATVEQVGDRFVVLDVFMPSTMGGIATLPMSARVAILLDAEAQARELTAAGNPLDQS